jgi:hypothetical protein
VPNMFDLEFEVQRRTEEVLKRRAEVEIRNKYIESLLTRRSLLPKSERQGE